MPLGGVFVSFLYTKYGKTSSQGLELFHGEAIVYIFIACIISYLFSGYHGIYTSQKINKAKSKILQIPEGETIDSLKKKENKI